MNKTGNKSFGSVLFGIIRTVFKPLTNDRGEVGGEDPTNPGEDPLEIDTTDVQQGGDPSTPPNPSDDDGEPGSPAGALNADQPADTKQKPGENEVDTRFVNSPRFQEMNTSLKETQDQLEQMQAQLEESNRMAQFYQQQFNETQNQSLPRTTPDATGIPGEKKTEPNVLPDGMVGPGEWDSQEQMGQWFEHTATTKAEQKAGEVLQNAYQQTFMPLISQITNAISDIQQNLARSGKDDFDDIIADVNKELFQIGPDGKVYGILDQARLNYFKAQPNPFEAMYKYGLTKKAPQKIKEGIQNQTKKNIQAIARRPATPTQIMGGDSPGDTPDLDWDTPPDQAEQILHKKGSI